MEEAAIVPHILLVSFPGQGHLNPLLRLANRIASKGVLVTFSSSLDIGHRIIAATKTEPETLIPVGKGHLRFEFFSDEWEDDDPRREDIDALINQLRMIGSREVKAMISKHGCSGIPISCIVNNPFIPWLVDVAEELNIPSAVLWVQSCSVFSIYYHYFQSLVAFPDNDSDPEFHVKLPGLPELKSEDLPTFLVDDNFKSLRNVILSQFSNIHKATWVFANSFKELEPDAIKALSSHVSLIPVGPLVDDPKFNRVRGDLWKAADCMDWLDSQEPNSVIYVSVGSVVVLTQEEIVEMANGLLNSQVPFLWVVRQKFQNLLPEEFIEKIKMTGKGMVISWSPQEQVLSHSAIACFVTHCGWNSTLEVLTAGMPVIAYPQFGDQATDAKFLVDVFGVGVRLRTPVKREDLEKCVEEVMWGEKAERMKMKALEWKEAARGLVAEGGSSDRNVEAFVEEIRARACGGGCDAGASATEPADIMMATKLALSTSVADNLVTDIGSTSAADSLATNILNLTEIKNSLCALGTQRSSDKHNLAHAASCPSLVPNV